jgi:DNA-binding transcriptional ArsR family regulator
VSVNAEQTPKTVMQEPTRPGSREGRSGWESYELTNSIHPAGVLATACKQSGPCTREVLPISFPKLGYPRSHDEIFFLTISQYLYNLLLMKGLSDLDAAFSALADPTRRAILARLAKGEATVMELAAPFEMTQPAISQHLKVLEDAGLVVRRVDGTKRPRRLAKAGVEAMDQWLAMLRKALEKSYDRLDEVLASMDQQKRGEKR